MNHEDIASPLLMKLNGLEIAFFSIVCQSTSPIIELENKIYLDLLDTEKIIQSINKARDSVQRIVIYIHWGVEESSYPTYEDILMARKLIEAGADIIIGSHAHAPQSIEKYKNGIIAQNLGNFLMPPFKKMPSYFDEKGISHSTYTKDLMLWNRISWGLIINMESMEYKIKKFILLFNRIIELPFTPLDKYIKLNKEYLNASYPTFLRKHLKKRTFARKTSEFIHRPHMPEKLKKMI